MSSLTKSFEKLAVTKTRTRGDTTSLLPSSYDPNAEDMPECPVPEISPSLYTPERLQQSLVYAQKFLAQRNISPRSELFMFLFKEEVKEALTAKSAEERELNTKMVMAEERLIRTKRFLQPLESAQSAELQERLLELRELQYCTRYGDYMKIIPAEVRYNASSKKFENWKMISAPTYWSEIAKTLRYEREAEQMAIRKGSVLDFIGLPATVAVHAACSDIGISKELAIWSIMEYGDRNLQVHRDLVDLRKEGKFHQLAKTLYADREELTSTFSEFKSETDLSSLKMIIQRDIDKWFDTSKNPDNPEQWNSTKALQDCWAKAVESASKSSKEEQRKANIEKAQRLSEGKAARQREAGKAGSATASKMRMASTEEPRGSELQRQERTTQQRFKLIAQKCKLEMEMEKINRELAILEEDDDLLDIPLADDD
ncbi:MAG: hypothetical protein Q9187_006526 [Circinaria calcarea]